MSTCCLCRKEIAPEDCVSGGWPAVCAWVPPGAGGSVYAIVSAHIACMGVIQLQQARKCLDDEAKKRGYHAVVFEVVERRLSALLAGVEPDPTATKAVAVPLNSLLEIE